MISVLLTSNNNIQQNNLSIYKKTFMQKLLTLKSECVIDLFFKQEKIKLSKTTARVFAFSDFNKD